MQFYVFLFFLVVIQGLVYANPCEQEAFARSTNHSPQTQANSPAISSPSAEVRSTVVRAPSVPAKASSKANGSNLKTAGNSPTTNRVELGQKRQEIIATSPEEFFRAMTEGLSLREGQESLFQFYMENRFPHPEKTFNSLTDVLDILKKYPQLTKLPMREQFLHLTLKQSQSPESLRSFIRSFQKSAGQIHNNLFQIEANLGYWMNMLGFTTTKPSASLSKAEKKALKAKQKQDFIAYLNTTALNQQTRDFVQDSSNPYKQRTIRLYQALEQILVSHNKLSEGSLSIDNQAHSEVTKKISQAMAELVWAVGFGNSAHRLALKSQDSFEQLEVLRQIEVERQSLSFDLSFEGHFAELKSSLGAKIADDSQQIKQLQEDIESQPYEIVGTKTLRLRPLSLQESAFRGCLGGDCSSESYFDKALDPNFLYFTLTDSGYRSSGHITVVLGEARVEHHQAKSGEAQGKAQGEARVKHHQAESEEAQGEAQNEGQKTKVAFVDKVQNIALAQIGPMLEGIGLSLKEHGYRLGLPKSMGNVNGIANDQATMDYIETHILPDLKKTSSHTTFKDFKPHDHEYKTVFNNSLFSRAYDSLDLWELSPTSFSKKEWRIESGKYPSFKLLNPDVTIVSLYASVLVLEKSLKVEDRLRFLDNLLGMHKVKDLDISFQYVEDYLHSVMQDSQWPFALRKKALDRLIEFYHEKNNQQSFNLDFLNKYFDFFTPKERKTLIGEISNWSKQRGYRRDFITRITDSLDIESFEHLKKIFKTDWSLILDKNELFLKFAYREQTDMMLFLLKRGADIEAKDNDGKTALLRAVDLRNVEVIKLLLREGSDIEAKNNYGDTALMEATRAGDVEVIKLLLREGSDIEAKSNNGYTALMIASLFGNIEVMKLLLDKEANIDAKDNNGDTALMEASLFGKVEVIKLLLREGGDIEAKDNHGRTALMKASRAGNVEVIELLLREGSNIEAKDNHGRTALMKASRAGNIEVIELLLREGGDIEAKDGNGRTALMEASRAGNVEVIELLLKRGADIEAKDNYGNTAFMKASRYRNVEVMQLLLREGSDIEAKNNNGDTALMEASRAGNVEVIELLLREGSDIEAKDNDGRTALMIASLTVIQGKNAFGSTATFMFASHFGNTEVIKLLKQAEAKIVQKDPLKKID